MDEAWLLQHFSEEELSRMGDGFDDDDVGDADRDWGEGGNRTGNAHFWASTDTTQTNKSACSTTRRPFNVIDFTNPAVSFPGADRYALLVV